MSLVLALFEHVERTLAARVALASPRVVSGEQFALDLACQRIGARNRKRKKDNGHKDAEQEAHGLRTRKDFTTTPQIPARSLSIVTGLRREAGSDVSVVTKGGS